MQKMSLKSPWRAEHNRAQLYRLKKLCIILHSKKKKKKIKYATTEEANEILC